MIRLVLADDQQVVRLGFRMILDNEPDMEVVGEAANGIAAIEAALELRPDVILTDVRMPMMDGIAATEAIVERCPEVRVLVVTTFNLDEYVLGALRAGAVGFLLKDVEPADLLAGIRTVMRRARRSGSHTVVGRLRDAAACRRAGWGRWSGARRAQRSRT